MSHFTKQKNYALLFLSQQALLPGRIANQMLLSRFVNTKGVPAGNIPADLHNEHLNRLCTEAVKALGSSKSKKCILRAGRALGTLALVLRQFDDDNGVPLLSGRHSVATAENDRDTIINDLQRCLIGIPKPKSLLSKGSREGMYSWITSKIGSYFTI